MDPAADCCHSLLLVPPRAAPRNNTGTLSRCANLSLSGPQMCGGWLDRY